ncbi:MAG TPA: hypothetical protein DD381_10680 [Lentisphaeria bacterium]|nr:MAG: hypothetical protein A2X47_01995 [Lentisphaerae bacterium GWF2_38_69]HBM16792.1 hypothetical protein [Lentisphaeria bacterium]
MTLIIAARCYDGCVIVSDSRQHIKNDTDIRYKDGYIKVLICGKYVIYNHGYNRIDNKDWKLQAKNLTPEVDNPVYKQIQEEMKSKPDKKAFYVFINKNELHEISIEVGNGVKYINHLPGDRLVSGCGAKYVDLGLLIDLNTKKYNKVRADLETTFLNAYNNQSKANGKEFSNGYTIKYLLS